MDRRPPNDARSACAGPYAGERHGFSRLAFTSIPFAAVVVLAVLLPLRVHAQPPVHDPLGERSPSPVMAARAIEPYASPDLQAASAEGGSSWQRWPFGSPDPTGGDLTGVQWVPADPLGEPGAPAEAWAMSVGPLDYDSAALHWDGMSWARTPLPPGAGTVSQVAPLAPHDVWAAGDAFLHWDGTSWQEVSSPSSDQLGELRLLPDGTGWAVGWDIAHYDGGQWKLAPKPTGKLLTSLTFSSDHEGWAVGDKGVKLRFGPAYTARGTVRDRNGELVHGVALKTSQGDVVFTAVNGTYVFGDLSAGPVTITPVRRGWVFDPPSRTLTAPPAAEGLDFVGRPYLPLFVPLLAK